MHTSHLLSVALISPRPSSRAKRVSPSSVSSSDCRRSVEWWIPAPIRLGLPLDPPNPRSRGPLGPWRSFRLKSLYQNPIFNGILGPRTWSSDWISPWNWCKFGIFGLVIIICNPTYMAHLFEGAGSRQYVEEEGFFEIVVWASSWET